MPRARVDPSGQILADNGEGRAFVQASQIDKGPGISRGLHILVQVWLVITSGLFRRRRYRDPGATGLRLR